MSNNIKNRPNKNQIISRSHSYHGSTFLSAAVSSRDADELYLTPKYPGVHFLSSVDLTEHLSAGTVEQYCTDKLREFEQKIIAIGPENIGAFIAEPVQASGGVIISPPGYLRQCKALCSKYDILYISDEVVTGFGRLGHWFASLPIFDVQPDIMICAKGLSSGYLPIGALLISDRLIDEIESRHISKLKLSQGFTYSGHPVCCAAALKNIEIIEREGLLAHVNNISAHFQSKLRELLNLPAVIEVHGMGLLGAVRCEMPNNQNNPAFNLLIVAKCRRAGLFVRSLMNQIVLSPPLIITLHEINLLFDRLRLGIEMASDEISKKDA